MLFSLLAVEDVMVANEVTLVREYVAVDPTSQAAVQVPKFTEGSSCASVQLDVCPAAVASSGS